MTTRPPEPLVIIGAGGLGREVAEAVRAVNEARPTWHLLGFLDDSPDVPRRLDGHPVLGPLAWLDRLPTAKVVVCVGSPTRNHLRGEVVARLGIATDRYATIVHPAAVVPPGTRIGAGSVLLASVVITAPIAVGSHVVVMPGTIFTHDDVIDDFATFAAGGHLAGGVLVGTGAYIGCGALVREHISVGAGAVIGMGAVVLRDVPSGEVWAGVPARPIGRVDGGPLSGAH
jgi:sugar O-acyltransferase (sialic acid O-acetyltransferase NeuD family)